MGVVDPATTEKVQHQSSASNDAELQGSASKDAEQKSSASKDAEQKSSASNDAELFKELSLKLPEKGREKAISILKEMSGIQFDPILLEVFLQILPEANEEIKEYEKTHKEVPVN